MEEHLCAHCGATLPRTGTFCLACDTPVTEPASGLSVGDTQVVAFGRPLVAAAAVAGVVLLVGVLAYGSVAIYQRHLNGSVAKAAKQAVTLLVRAEAGHAGACTPAALLTTGVRHDQACVAMVDDDPGARIRRLHVSAVHRHGREATAYLRGTLVDQDGRRPYAAQVAMVRVDNAWALRWDGTPIAAR
ncbi:hypothetical protein EFK50_04290 [Nocardioides marmoriginsengisoli]|uniref:Zinc ribbon domain-containing protein n=1 Tax=Nocardioides marmoriginsengisoli TaxID=661483 RepID=A0A3N0CPG7_9ACTN|nr:hypothetical protein [Nocardioides marmoriginsengisoli]RNL65191.1 hypothetical protein EFK50_04290 [Nocardioides marmoriginsengisoli]